MKKSRKYFYFVIIIVLILVLILTLIVNIVYNSNILDRREILAKVKVTDHYGFDINSTSLNFGLTRPGGGSLRNIILRNTYGKDVHVDIYTTGNISDFITLDENSFLLSKDEIKNLSFNLLVPSNIHYGSYEGNVIIEVTKK